MLLYRATTLLPLIAAIHASFPPKLAESVPKKSQNAGTSLKIFCQAQEGTKPFRFVWSKNDQLLTSTAPRSSYRIETTEEDSLLVIDKLSVSDSASYSCQVQNEYGKANQGTVVTVKGTDHIFILSQCVAHIESCHSALQFFKFIF